MPKNNQTQEERMQMINEVFDNFDKDKGGYIDSRELASVLRALGRGKDQKEIDEFMEKVDKNKNGRIERQEFMDAMNEMYYVPQTTVEEVVEAFKIFDKNSDDLISIDELREVMTILGQYVWNETPSDEEIVQMIKDADEDFDGYLNFSEFLKKIQSIH